MERSVLTAKRGWAAIGLFVCAYEIACPPNELLSEGVDKALERHKILTTLAIGVTALHLANGFDAVHLEKYDPFSRVINTIKQ